MNVKNFKWNLKKKNDLSIYKCKILIVNVDMVTGSVYNSLHILSVL